MSLTIKNVAVVGATGNTGPTVVKTLLTSGFEVIALSRSIENARKLLGPDVKVVEVDYLSEDSLSAALQGVDAVVVCGVGMLPEQINLINASISAGVQRFIPADFAGDLTSPLLRSLHINKNKITTEEYLRNHESSISHTSIRTGPLFDFLLPLGILIDMKSHTMTRRGDGNKRFSTTTISTAAKAVVAVLKMGEKSKNRAFKVQDLVTSQNELLKFGKELTPGVEWKVEVQEIEEIRKGFEEANKLDPNSRLSNMLEKALAVFAPEFPADFGVGDNKELGIDIMDEGQVKEVLKRFQ